MKKDLEEITNRFVSNVENNLEKFRYNKIVANFHELYGSLSKLKIEEYSSASLKKNYLKILTTMMPVIPHYSSECIQLLNLNLDVKWPEIDNKNLKQDNTNYVVQINGKTRKIISKKNNLSEEDLMKFIKKDQIFSKYIKSDTNIKKTIFIPNKLINIIIG